MLVIVEDPTLDQFVVKPVIDKLFEELSVRARVEVLRDPHLRGVEQATSIHVLSDVVELNPMVDLFLLVVDRDCNRTSIEDKVKEIEARFARKILPTLAIEELEVWMLAVFEDSPLNAKWADVRSHCDPKETFAEPFLKSRGWYTEVGKGRKRAMRELNGNWRRLLSRCPEIAGLKARLEDWLASSLI